MVQYRRYVRWSHPGTGRPAWVKVRDHEEKVRQKFLAGHFKFDS